MHNGCEAVLAISRCESNSTKVGCNHAWMRTGTLCHDAGQFCLTFDIGWESPPPDDQTPRDTQAYIQEANLELMSWKVVGKKFAYESIINAFK